jgi:hypothetical protein
MVSHLSVIADDALRHGVVDEVHVVGEVVLNVLAEKRCDTFNESVVAGRVETRGIVFAFGVQALVEEGSEFWPLACKTENSGWDKSGCDLNGGEHVSEWLHNLL